MSKRWKSVTKSDIKKLFICKSQKAIKSAANSDKIRINKNIKNQKLLSTKIMSYM